MFARKERLADILWDLELATRNKFNVSTERPDGMSIEHVMPRRWPGQWHLPDGQRAPVDKFTGADPAMLTTIRERERLLYTIGNLTLITVPAKSAASNAAFGAKKHWLGQNLLAINLEIVANNVWDKVQIDDRARALADRAVTLWPHPVH